MTLARALLLDIGGVVLRNARELLRGQVSQQEPEVAAFVDASDLAGPGDELYQQMLRHEVTERTYWARRAIDIGQVRGQEAWSTYDMISWLYHRPEGGWLNEEVVDLMVDTRAAGLPLVALTNDLVDFHGQEWVDRQDWLKHFDTVVDGSINGVLKPHPDAYRFAVDAVGVPAGEIVYLDDMPINVRAALDAGLQAIEVLYADRHAAVKEARMRLGLS